jgi:hypothetical protein
MLEGTLLGEFFLERELRERGREAAEIARGSALGTPARSGKWDPVQWCLAVVRAALR